MESDYEAGDRAGTLLEEDRRSSGDRNSFLQRFSRAALVKAVGLTHKATSGLLFIAGSRDASCPSSWLFGFRAVKGKGRDGEWGGDVLSSHLSSCVTRWARA